MNILTFQGCGCNYSGSEEAIEAILSAGLVARIEWLKKFCPEVRFEGTFLPEKVQKGKFLVIGSDHAITPLVVDSLAVDKIGIIHFDAHADLEDVGSGQAHGAVITRLIEMNKVPPQHIVQIGIRDFSTRELTRSRSLGAVFTAADVAWQGIRPVVTTACEFLESRVPNIYITFDLDVISPNEFSAVNTPRNGGISLAEANVSLAYLFQRNSIIGGDINEYNPKNEDGRRNCAGALFDLIASANGYSQLYSKLE